MRSRIPWVPSPQPVVKKMLEMACLKPGLRLWDLGAGDGRIVISAASDFNVRAIGVELDKTMVEAARRRIQRGKVMRDAWIHEGSFYDFSLRDADVVTMYLLPEANLRLRAKLEAELPTRASVICLDYPIPGWTPEEVENIQCGSHLYRIYRYKPGGNKSTEG
ncbi:MAG: SAM-dependent methyltransferase [Candidatus Bathyarchaeia archaeon]